MTHMKRGIGELLPTASKSEQAYATNVGIASSAQIIHSFVRSFVHSFINGPTALRWALASSSVS
jgi:hypothetical protein